MMSTTKKKPVKNKRDIFEATDQPHDTENYRNELVDQWILYQQNEPASLHAPTVLGSNAPSATQKSRPPPTSTSQRQKEMYDIEQQRMKKRKHEHKDMPKFDDFGMQPPFGIDNMDEPFFEFDVDHSISNNNNNNDSNRYYDNNRMLNDALASKTQNRATKQPNPKQPYDSNIGGDNAGPMNVYSVPKADHHHHRRHHHQSQSHQIDVRASNKRHKPANQHSGNDDLAEFHDFQFNFDAGQTVMQQQQQLVQKENKKKEDKTVARRMHGRDIDKGQQGDPFIDFDAFEGAFDEDAKQPTPQFIYKRFKERSYAELMGTTPAWQKADNDVHERDAIIQGKANDDGFLFKHPEAILGAEQKVIEKFDERDRRHHIGRDHREQRAKNRHLNQQYVISHEIEQFIPKTSDANKECHVLKMGHNRTATATASSTQPNIFYIKCNNLIIKHD